MWATSSMDYAIDPSPLLTAGGAVGGRPRVARPSLRGAARLLSRASNRHVMREPSLLVREAAAEQLEERQSDWAYSRPVVFLDVLWNLAFVAAAAGVLVLSRKETPVMPLRLWIGGYTLQCVLHIVCVCVQYRRRHLQRGAEGQDGQDGQDGQVQDSSASSSQTDLVEAAGQDQSEQFDGIAKFLESANTMFSFIWWIIGFYWVSVGGQALTNDAPQLYWLCIVFLAFDVFFVVFCVALACVIGIAVCCCLPCIIAILYAVADQQEGASDEEIRQLPSYRFRRICNSEELSDEVQRSLGGVMSDCCSDPPIEHLISDEDAECCICLSAYDDGVELRELPCGHHFHCGCIDKWLYISSTCPLCKYNITSNNNQGREEV